MSTFNPGSKDALLVIDLQNDFCPGGNLAVPEGDTIIDLVNSMAKKFETAVLTQDWHPAGHSSFASSHPGLEAFSLIEMPYGPQTLWPDHCIQNTPGAQLCEELDVPNASLIIRKGFRADVDSYSAFFENDHATPTGLDGYLRERGIERVFCCGLALDYCVRFSAEDARKLGYDVVVLTDACRAIDLDGSLQEAIDAMEAAGILLTESSAIG